MGLFLCAGVGVLYGDTAGLPLAAALGLCAGAGVLALKLHSTTLALAALAVAIAGVHTRTVSGCLGAQFEENLRAGPVTVAMRGMVLDEPRGRGSGRMRFLLRVEGPRAKPDFTESFKMTVRAPEGVQLLPGDRIAVFGIASWPDSPGNPGQFDYGAHLRRMNVRGVVDVRSGRDLSVLQSGAGWFRAALHRWRSACRSILATGLEEFPEQAAVLRGIALGASDDAPEGLLERFRRAGALHLFTVSGLHVSMLALLAFSVCNIVGVPQAWRAAICLSAAGLYVLLAGAETPAVRAAIMLAVVFGAPLAGRKPAPLNSLFAAAFVLVALDTNELFRPSFHLSFGAVAAIVLLHRPLNAWAVRRSARDEFLPPTLEAPAIRKLREAGRGVLQLAGMSAAALIGTAPAAWWNFHTLAPASLATNLAAVPAAFAVLASGILSLFCGVVLPWAVAVCNMVGVVAAGLVMAGVEIGQRIPGGAFSVRTIPEAQDGRLGEILILDLPRSLVALVATGESPPNLLNAGRVADYAHVVRPVLAAHGIGRLEWALFLRGDAAHYGGAADCCAEFRPTHVAVSAVADRTAYRAALEESIAAGGGARLHRIGPGDTFVAGGGIVKVEQWHPGPGRAYRNAEDRAMALLMQIGEARVLVMSGGGYRVQTALREDRGEDLVGVDLVVRATLPEDEIHDPDFARLTRCVPAIVSGEHAFSREGDVVAMQRAREFSTAEWGAIRIGILPGRLRIESHRGGLALNIPLRHAPDD